MRRLTKIEKNIVKEIEKKLDIPFKELIKDESSDLLTFSTYERDNNYYLTAHIVDTITKEKATEITTKTLTSIITIARLVKLLEQNGLIYIYSFRLEGNEKFIGQTITALEQRQRYFSENNCGKDMFELLKVGFLNVHSTPALEMYVKNKFRTEEQKQNDFNRSVGRITLGIAVTGLLLSGIFSGLTYFDTKERFSVEDKRYIEKQKEDSQLEIKNHIFKNEVMIQVDKASDGIDSIRKDLKNR